MDNWMNHIPTGTLEKGYNYFESGSICAIKRETKGWRVTVMGSRDYSVFVPNSMEPKEARCTCPHYADGNICKHIAAAFIAVNQKQNKDNSEQDPKKTETIVMNANVEDLRKLIIDLAQCDDHLERILRAKLGTADKKQAKIELQKVTTSLMRRFERGGFIDWREAMDFEQEYSFAVDSIMEPFFLSKDVDALVDLVVPRFVQLQRICIDDSDGFFTNALGSITEHISQAFTWGDSEQRQQLFDILDNFIKKNPGKDQGDIYWYEQETAENALWDLFSEDAKYAAKMIEVAKNHLNELGPVPEDRYDWAYPMG